jgi:general secretion pathway protein G
MSKILKMLNKKVRKDNKGFTLVELLVVIAIIGILAAVAIPTVFKNIDKSKVADLESDYNAIKTAVLSYSSDNSGTLADEIGDLTPYLDQAAGKTPFKGAYTLSTDGKNLVLSGADFNMPAESLKKLGEDLGSVVSAVATDNSAITNAGIAANTKAAKSVTIVISQ